MFFFVSFFCNIEYKFRFVLCHGLFTRCNAYVLTYLLHGAEIHPNIIHLSKPRSHQWSLSLRLPHQDPIHPLSSPICATCPAHLILLDFITRTILGEEYRSLSSSLCNLLHSPHYLVPPRFKYSPQHPQLPFLPQCERPSFTPIQNDRKNYRAKIMLPN